MSIGIVGAGNMGRSIARRLGGTGERVVLADRDRDKADAVVAEIDAGDGLRAGEIADAIAADVVVLALWYPGTTELAGEHVDALEGKVVVDITNPLDESFIRLATDPSTSSAELLAEKLPESRVVKAFNTTTAPVLFDGRIGDVMLDVFVASDDEEAKWRVSKVMRLAGLRPIDAGLLDNARLLERLMAFELELNQRYDLGYRLSFKLLPVELSATG